MKRLCIITVIILLIIGASLFSIQNISKTNAEMNLHLERLVISAQEEDYTASSNTIAALQEKWQKKSKQFDMYVKHENVDSIQLNLIQLEAFCSLKQYDKMLPIIRQIQYSLKQIYEGEIPDLKNIF